MSSRLETNGIQDLARGQIEELTASLDPTAIRRRTDTVLMITKLCAVPAVFFILFIDYRFGRLISDSGDWAILVALNTFMVLGVFVAYDALRGLLNQWRDLLSSVDMINKILGQGDGLIKRAAEVATDQLKELKPEVKWSVEAGKAAVPLTTLLEKAGLPNVQDRQDTSDEEGFIAVESG